MAPVPGLRALITLAWPIVLARSAQSVISFSDAAMVAPLGDDALAAATTGAMNALGILILPMGITFIVQSYAAQLAGQGDLASARRYAWYGLALAGLAMLAALPIIPAIAPVLALTGHAPAVREVMGEYMAIRMLSTGVVVGTEALGNWFAGLGDTRVAMRASLTAMVVNLALNWVLIYGNLGAPALGVQGAAWASVLASVAGFAVCCHAFWRARHQRTIDPATVGPVEHPVPVLSDRQDGRLGVREFARMMRFGLPNGLNWFLEFAAFLIFINLVVAELGTVAVAALMAVTAVNSVSFMPAFGLGSAGAVLVGQAIGAGHHDHVPRIVLRTFAVAASWQGVVGLLYFAIPVPLMMVFARDEVESSRAVVELGAQLLAISAVWQLLDATVITVNEALRAAGDTAWPLVLRISLAWVIWLPLAWLTVFTWDGGAAAATWSMVVYMVALAAAMVLRFRSGAWRRIDLTGRGTAA
ncbi:MATE family efflux transporter [Nannocystis bainbridge]|uniref:Multidrug-efflux transporter n=1 Tax=Nannocystis bainbridge TaxID=2995303 RepID=A0ABT5E088_9BACT|nr:MATE family efflux transporter [Nannocystis bainbridge]MDC0719290.1 MATE family efflux transporter [Nannocystis bainbridge]